MEVGTQESYNVQNFKINQSPGKYYKIITFTFNDPNTGEQKSISKKLEYTVE